MPRARFMFCDIMCCFSRPVQYVSTTNIFARASNGRQLLVYEMEYGADRELAMILPLPVPAASHERSVRYISLERYPAFFGHMRQGFPDTLTFGAVRLSGGLAAATKHQTLKVHDVGSFEASFVPAIGDFERLDERFRIDRAVWDAIPEYADYGFAVIKLKASSGSRVHPIALEFPRRDKERLFFPTVHVHDGELHDRAYYDHSLFCQGGGALEPFVRSWEMSKSGAGRFMDVERAQGILTPNEFCWRLTIKGRLTNTDCWVGPDGQLPTDRPAGVPASAVRRVCRDCGLVQYSTTAKEPCDRCGGELT